MTKKHKKHHKSEREAFEENEEKPLKLVLKVSTPEQSQTMATPESPPEREEKHRHKHKKKKKKHKHEHRHHHDKKEKRKRDRESDCGDDAEEKGDEDEVERNRTEEAIETDDRGDNQAEDNRENDDAKPPLCKRQALSFNPADYMSNRHLRERRLDDDRTHLQMCLDYLHKILVRKDTNGFFAFPVTDQIAPDYSRIIAYPMDFSTMKIKIKSNQYNSVADYRADFKQMLENCMIYNRSDTIFCKEARRIMAIGIKQLSREKLMQMRKNLPFLSGLTDEDIGPDDMTDEGDVVDGESAAAKKAQSAKPKSKPKLPTSKYEAIPDDLTPEEILAEAQAAAKDAADTLTLRKPNSKIGFLRQRSDGSTTLNILNPDNDGIVSETEKVVNLGMLTGKLQSGAHNLTGFKEDKRNKATPVTYLNYGPFSSYAPIFDSTTANLSKEDSDLLLSTYGDETGVQYAKSLQNVVADAGDYAIKMVDSLLDILTRGDHSKMLKVQAENEKQKQDDRKTKVEDEQCLKESVQAVKNGDGEVAEKVKIVTALETAGEKENGSEEQLQKKLDETTELIRNLAQTQYHRLSQKPPGFLAHVSGPSRHETQLAEKVTEELTDLTKRATPGSITNTQVIRSAIGISVDINHGEEPEAQNIETVETIDH